MDVTTATKAGLSQSEIAQALGVCRVTVNLWSRGKMKPHKLHAERLAHRMEVLVKAITQGLIPPQDPRRKPRHAAILDAMRQVDTTTIQ